ncbi:MAG: acylglycerol kinase family protein, partial [Actinomycetota bacterium]
MSSLSHWLVVFNPSAGKSRSHKRRRAVLEALTLNGHSFDLVNSSDRAESLEMLQEYLASDREYRGVLVIGGDGTMHIVADKVWRSGKQLPIALLPHGTGNDFARQLG